MSRESYIRILRSTTTDTPSGLTFGELAFSDLNNKLFVGDAAGNSIWIGGEVTGGDITNNSAYMVPTQASVKAYVDGTVGGGSVVNTINATGGAITITGAGAILFSQVGKDNTINARIASTSVTGVAYYSSDTFAVAGDGLVTVKNAGITNAQLQNSSVTVNTGSGLAGGGSVALGSSITLTNTGVTAFNGQAGQITLTGAGAVLFSQVAGANTINVREATTSATGVASFNSANFDVTNGSVTIKPGGVTNGSLANSSVTVSAGPGLDGGGTVALGGTVTLNNAGVISFNGLTGTVAFSVTGDGAAIVGVSSNVITARVATTSLTGVASFNGAFFTVGTTGNVSIANSSIGNSQLTNSSVTIDAGGSSTLSLGNTLTLTGGVQNNLKFSNSSNTITATLADDVTISGNLTVNGTVVTANVDTFTVEDPLFMLGTGNAADSVDIGFYGQYTSSGKQFTGFFRDASDGKYRLFTGLSGAAEPTTTVNTGGAGYTVATLVANIDGGTF